jgi:hypothetical protein
MKSKILRVLLLVAGLIALTMPGQSQKNSEVAKEVIHKQRELPIVDFPEKGSTLESLSLSKSSRGVVMTDKVPNLLERLT